MKYTVVGDVHGKIKEFTEIANENERTIQLGDFGFNEEHEYHLKNFNPHNHKVVFGNHDDPFYLDKPHSCKDFSFSKNRKLMTIRGAQSVDRYRRTEGVDWWREEEMTYSRLNVALALFEKVKPEIVISHTCPKSLVEDVFGFEEYSTTCMALQEMFNAHQPKLWIFGHFHKSVEIEINGTKFICLNELETLQINI